MNKFIGDRAFYKRVLRVMLPITLQNVITNFVSILDNIMVGQLGTEPMSAVAIVNQLFFVYAICLLGGTSGAGIFTAQYSGKGDDEGIAQTVRIKLMLGLGILTAALALCLTIGDRLVMAFIHDGDAGLDTEATFGYAMSYLRIILLGLPAFTLTQVFASTLSETGETVVPMRASVVSMLTNFVGNCILIFGLFGAPALGVRGAAIATVTARYLECAIVLGWNIRHRREKAYVGRVFADHRIPTPLLKNVAMRGLPLMVNEMLWSGGVTMVNQSYSMRGLDAVAAVSIANSTYDLFMCGCFAMGTTVSIIIGQVLGSGDLERAVDEDRKLIALSLAIAVMFGGLLTLAAPYIPMLYNAAPSVQSLASSLLCVIALLLPVNSFENSCYFTMRSGGRVLITMLFDSVYLWVLSWPVSFVLTRFTALSLVPVFILVRSMDFLKCIAGYILVKKRVWVRNLVAE